MKLSRRQNVRISLVVITFGFVFGYLSSLGTKMVLFFVIAFALFILALFTGITPRTKGNLFLGSFFLFIAVLLGGVAKIGCTKLIAALPTIIG